MSSETILSSFTKLKKSDVNKSKDVIFSGNERNDIRFYQTARHDSTVKTVLITYNGELLSRTEVDSNLITFNFSLTKLSVKYDKSDIEDYLFIKEPSGISQNDTVKLNMLLGVCKRNKALYFIFVCPESEGVLIDSSFLPNLLRQI